MISPSAHSSSRRLALTIPSSLRMQATSATLPRRRVREPGRPIDAGNGFEAFVSFGTPVSPVTGTNWEGTGVAPDVAASSEAALEVAPGLAREAAAVKDDGIRALIPFGFDTPPLAASFALCRHSRESGNPVSL